jgi:hypothetical protein
MGRAVTHLTLTSSRICNNIRDWALDGLWAAFPRLRTLVLPKPLKSDKAAPDSCSPRLLAFCRCDGKTYCEMTGVVFEMLLRRSNCRDAPHDCVLELDCTHWKFSQVQQVREAVAGMHGGHVRVVALQWQ